MNSRDKECQPEKVENTAGLCAGESRCRNALKVRGMCPWEGVAGCVEHFQGNRSIKPDGDTRECPRTEQVGHPAA